MSEDLQPPTLNSEPKIELREGEKVIRAPARYGLSDPWDRRPLSEHSPQVFFPDTAGGMLAAHNEQLKYVRYIAFDTTGKTSFEMHLSDEALQMTRASGWDEVRTLLEQDMEKMRRKPFGRWRSLDPKRKDPNFRRLRAINRASRRIEKILQTPVAIKSPGVGPLTKLEHENLTEQYLLMRKLSISAEKLPDDVKEILAVCKMYGVIRISVERNLATEGIRPPYYEWLIMERVENGKQMDEDDVGVFSVTKNENLINTLKPYAREKFPIKILPEGFRYFYLEFQSILKDLGLEVTDLAGRNILVTKLPDGRLHYTVIDQSR